MALVGSFVHIGKIHSAQGLKGEIYVSIFSGEAAWSDEWVTLFISDSESPDTEIPIESKKLHMKQKRYGFRVKLKGVNDRNQSEALVGKNVFIPEDFLTSDNDEEIYLREVLGFVVEDSERGRVGEVIGFLDNGVQDLLVVKTDKGESFEVPFVEPILVEIDKDKEVIEMDIPYGLVPGEEL
ncbi:MAG: 16S rRNA processing protein RimM [Bdellovibrionales bacterium]|nr:16S rRNA processing protein RimM [Bdellovibrionales bacterium]